MLCSGLGWVFDWGKFGLVSPINSDYAVKSGWALRSSPVRSGSGRNEESLQCITGWEKNSFGSSTVSNSGNMTQGHRQTFSFVVVPFPFPLIQLGGLGEHILGIFWGQETFIVFCSFGGDKIRVNHFLTHHFRGWLIPYPLKYGRYMTY